ncbi:MAG: hypothetical protein ACM3UV_08595, partial [Nocardioidaceae bacterium]
ALTALIAELKAQTLDPRLRALLTELQSHLLTIQHAQLGSREIEGLLATLRRLEAVNSQLALTAQAQNAKVFGRPGSALDALLAPQGLGSSATDGLAADLTAGSSPSAPVSAAASIAHSARTAVHRSADAPQPAHLPAPSAPHGLAAGLAAAAAAASSAAGGVGGALLGVVLSGLLLDTLGRSARLVMAPARTRPAAFIAVLERPG